MWQWWVKTSLQIQTVRLSANGLLSCGWHYILVHDVTIMLQLNVTYRCRIWPQGTTCNGRVVVCMLSVRQAGHSVRETRGTHCNHEQFIVCSFYKENTNTTENTAKINKHICRKIYSLLTLWYFFSRTSRHMSHLGQWKNLSFPPILKQTIWQFNFLALTALQWCKLGCFLRQSTASTINELNIN